MRFLEVRHLVSFTILLSRKGEVNSGAGAVRVIQSYWKLSDLLGLNRFDLGVIGQ